VGADQMRAIIREELWRRAGYAQDARARAAA